MPIQPTATDNESASTLRDLSKRFSVSLPYLYSEIKAGRLKIRKFGRATRVFERDVQAWLSSLPTCVKS